MGVNGAPACPDLALLEGLAPRLRTADYLTSRDRIEAELGNFRAAMEWSLPVERGDDKGDVRIGFRLCQQLTWYWYACGYPEEGRRWLERATKQVKGEEPEEINVLHGLGVILLQQGESEAARQLLTRCLNYCRRQGDDSQTARELNSLGIAYRYTDEHDKARELFEEGICLAERSGDKSRLASLLANLGVLETDVGAAESAGC